MAKSNGERILTNTLALYFRQIISLLVGLFTVRVVLSVLGSEDYGINNVVAGAVTMFSFLSGSMATGSQRFFSFYLGKDDNTQLSKVFQTTLTIYLLLSVILLILGETFGLWFINNKLVIPSYRINAANWIYQFAMISFLCTVMSTPFKSAIMAHEDMTVYAKYGLFEVFFKLLLTVLLYISPIDKLVSYGFLMLLLSFLMLIMYQLFCMKHYGECVLKFSFEKRKLAEIASFSGWNLFGSFAWVIKNQGTSFLMNILFGPIVNAAQSLATQIRTIVSSFSENFSAAVKPQIVKKYSVDDYKGLFSLAFTSSKLLFLLMAVFCIPLLFNIEPLLGLWLTEVPQYTVIFTKLMLIESAFEVMSSPMAMANQATGKIGLYQFFIGFFGILNLPLSYFAIKHGYNPECVYVISIFCQFLIIIERMLFLERISPKSFINSITATFIPCIAFSFVSYGICYFLYVPNSNLLIVIGTCIYEFLLVAALGFLLLLKKNEKQYCVSLIRNFARKKNMKYYDNK